MTKSLTPAGVIFDFDGVVVDSLAVHIKAWQIAYKKRYHTELTDTAGLPGRSTMAIADILSTRAGQPGTKEELAELKRDALRSSHLKIELLPGVRESFEWLTVHKTPFGIASNAPREFIENTLKTLGIFVEHKFGIDDVARAKPEPDVFLRCAKALSISVIDHPRVLVLEDSPHGIKAAVRAGMFPIGVLTQNTSAEMRHAGALACCDDAGKALASGWFERLPPQP